LQLLIAVANNTPSALTSLFGIYYNYLKILSFGTGENGSKGANNDSIMPALITPLAGDSFLELQSKKCIIFT